MEEYIGTKEAAKLCGKTQNTIRKWCREGKLLGAEQDAPRSPWRTPKEIIKAICEKENEQ